MFSASHAPSSWKSQSGIQEGESRWCISVSTTDPKSKGGWEWPALTREEWRTCALRHKPASRSERADWGVLKHNCQQLLLKERLCSLSCVFVFLYFSFLISHLGNGKSLFALFQTVAKLFSIWIFTFTMEPLHLSDCPIHARTGTPGSRTEKVHLKEILSLNPIMK